VDEGQQVERETEDDGDAEATGQPDRRQETHVSLQQGSGVGSALKRAARDGRLHVIAESAHATHRAIPTTSKAREPRLPVVVAT